MKKSDAAFLYALSLYSAISVVFTAAQYWASIALVYTLYLLVNLSLGPDGLHLVKTSVYDSAGFAFLTVTNTLIQYYLGSLLAHDLKARPALYGILFFSALASVVFFIKISAHSNFGAYMFACLPLIVSYLLGGTVALLQKEPENPFHTSRLNLFRIN